jgi:hypothetical protein
MRKQVSVFVIGLLLLASVLIFSGCTKKEGQIDAKLSEKTIDNEASTDLIMKIKNTGEEEMTYNVSIVPELPGMVVVNENRENVFTIRPNEYSSERRINLIGYTQAHRTEYEISVILYDNSTGEEIERENLYLMVKK